MPVIMYEPGWTRPREMTKSAARRRRVRRNKTFRRFWQDARWQARARAEAQARAAEMWALFGRPEEGA